MNHRIINPLIEEGGWGTISCVTCQLFLAPTSAYEATCHKHQQLMLSLGFEPKHIAHQGQARDWCAVLLSSPPGARITLDLNNSSKLLVISARLTSRLRPLLNWKILQSPGTRFFLCIPLNMQTDAIAIKGNCSFLKGLCKAAVVLHLGNISQLDWRHSNTPLHL